MVYHLGCAYEFSIDDIVKGCEVQRSAVGSIEGHGCCFDRELKIA